MPPVPLGAAVRPNSVATTTNVLAQSAPRPALSEASERIEAAQLGIEPAALAGMRVPAVGLDHCDPRAVAAEHRAASEPVAAPFWPPPACTESPAIMRVSIASLHRP